MPNISQEELVKQYWEEVKHKYPNLDYTRFRNICRSPFYFIRRCMAMPSMPTILVKYLGKFRVFPSTFKKLLEVNEKNYQRGYINEKMYLERKENYKKMYDSVLGRYMYEENLFENDGVIIEENNNV